MIIKTAKFIISNSDYKKCPDTKLPEYAFTGRSNVGKSSLIDRIVFADKVGIDEVGIGEHHRKEFLDWKHHKPALDKAHQSCFQNDRMMAG